MKKTFLVVFPLSAMLTGCAALIYQPAPQVSYNPPPENSQTNVAYPNYDSSLQTDQVFYDQLSPYGTWIDYPDYGYVWAPAVDSDFRPYATNGSWVYSDYGWTWASGYDWGWATFHYGRWFYDDNYGWLWMPGDEWAPAWVTWGTTGDYYCWAPLPPRVTMQEANLGWWHPAPNTWNVVPGRRVTQVNISNYVVYNTTIINNIKVINNSSNYYGQGNRGANYGGVRSSVEYNRGPQLIDVEKVTNNRINTVTVNEQTKPGAVVVSGNRIGIYRPQINSTSNGSQAPQRYERYKGNQGQQQNNNPGNNGQFNYPSKNNGQNTQPGYNPNSNQTQYQRGNNGQNQQPLQNPNNNQNPYQRGTNGQNQQPVNSPNNNQSQYQRGNNGQNQQPLQNPNSGQSTEEQNRRNQNPDKNYKPPAQQQPNTPAAQNKTGNNGQVQNSNQQQNRTENNPALRQSLQPVHNNNGQPLNNKNQPKAKPDTAKRRPNNQ